MILSVVWMIFGIIAACNGNYDSAALWCAVACCGGNIALTNGEIKELKEKINDVCGKGPTKLF